MASNVVRSLRFAEVLILRDLKGNPHTMRIPDSVSVDGYIDADIIYDDLLVELLDEDVVLRQRAGGGYYVGYSDQTLGRE